VEKFSNFAIPESRIFKIQLKKLTVSKSATTRYISMVFVTNAKKKISNKIVDKKMINLVQISMLSLEILLFLIPTFANSK